MLIRSIILSGIFLFGIKLFAATDSLQLSLLTCDPGEELYSTFGHTALKVQDLRSGQTYVFNYGTFNFREPNFYLKFMRGKLNYYLTVQDLDSFLSEYTEENRAVHEQILNLSDSAKHIFFEALKLNARPENRAYKYDFFWDNCSTRIRDKIEQGYDHQINYLPIAKMTFRDLLHKYLVDKPWSRFGIDLILGLPCDEIADTRKSMFLPIEMMHAFDTLLVENPSWMKHSEIVLSSIPYTKTKSVITPAFVFTLILIWMIMLFYLNKGLFNLFSNIFMISTGIGGCIIGFLWFFSDHVTTIHNLHFIWASPLALLYPFRRGLFNESFLKKLSLIYLVLLGLLMLSLPFGPQKMPFPCVLIWLTLAWIVVRDILPSANGKNESLHRIQA